MSRTKECEECGMEYYSETLSPTSFRHVFPEMVDRGKMIKRLAIELGCLFAWAESEAEHFDGNMPDLEMIDSVKAALLAAKEFVK